MAEGVSLDRAYELATRLEHDLADQGTRAVEIDRLEELAAEVLEDARDVFRERIDDERLPGPGAGDEVRPAGRGAQLLEDRFRHAAEDSVPDARTRTSPRGAGASPSLLLRRHGVRGRRFRHVSDEPA